MVATLVVTVGQLEWTFIRYFTHKKVLFFCCAYCFCNVNHT